MRGLALVCVLGVVVTGCADQPLPAAPTPTRGAVPTIARTTTPTAAAAAVTPTGQTRFEFAGELAGAIGPQGNPPAAGEITCRGRVLMVLDMRPRPPLGLVSATFEIEMTSCPDGTAITDAHVHTYVQPHADKIHIAAAVTRPASLSGGSGTVISTNQGVDPRLASEVIADPTSFGVFLHTERNPNGGAGRGPLRTR